MMFDMATFQHQQDFDFDPDIYESASASASAASVPRGLPSSFKARVKPEAPAAQVKDDFEEGIEDGKVLEVGVKIYDYLDKKLEQMVYLLIDFMFCFS